MKLTEQERSSFVAIMLQEFYAKYPTGDIQSFTEGFIAGSVYAVEKMKEKSPELKANFDEFVACQNTQPDQQ